MVCQLKKVFAMRSRKPEEKTVPPAATPGMGPACARVCAGQAARVIATEVHLAGGQTR